MLRNALGLTLRDVAHAVGSSAGCLSRVERRESIPRADLVMRLNRWAAIERTRRKLSADHVLDWSHLADQDTARRRDGEPVPDIEASR